MFRGHALSFLCAAGSSRLPARRYLGELGRHCLRAVDASGMRVGLPLSLDRSWDTVLRREPHVAAAQRERVPAAILILVTLGYAGGIVEVIDATFDGIVPQCAQSPCDADIFFDRVVVAVARAAHALSFSISKISVPLFLGALSAGFADHGHARPHVATAPVARVSVRAIVRFAWCRAFIVKRSR